MNKIILGDNQAIFRAGIAKVLASEEDFRVAAQCSDMARMVLAVDTYRSSIGSSCPPFVRIWRIS